MRRESDEPIMMWRALSSAVASTMSAAGAPTARRLSAANWLAPAKTISDMSRLSHTEKPAVSASMPNAAPLGIMPVMTGRLLRAPRRNSAARPPSSIFRPPLREL